RQTGYSQPIPKAGIGGSPRFAPFCGRAAGDTTDGVGGATGGVSAVGKPGTANQFQRRELVAVPVLRLHRQAYWPNGRPGCGLGGVATPGAPCCCPGCGEFILPAGVPMAPSAFGLG